MNRSTIVMVLVLCGLVGLWATSGSKKTAERLPALTVDGFLTKEISLQDIKILNKDEKSPYTKFIIKRTIDKGPVTYTIELDPSTANEKKASDKKWWVTREFNGRTLKAKAENYRLRIFNQGLARNFRSSMALKASEDQLKEYGLNPENAISMTAVSPKQTVKLVIGNKFKLSEDSSATWVMNQDTEGVVYQVSGFDLRHHFDASWKDIRDRKILDVNLAAITKVELSNPQVKGSEAIVLTRPPLTDEQRKSLADGTEWSKVRKSSDDWTVVKPAGLKLDDPELSGWLESLGRMSATEYVDLTGGKVPSESGLDDPKLAINVKLIAPEATAHVRIGKLMPKGQEQDVFVQVVGQDDEVYGVAGWMASQIKASRQSLRDRRLTADRAVKDAVALTIETKGKTFSATKTGGTWRSPTIEIDPNNVIDFLKDLDGVRIEWPTDKTVDKHVLAGKISKITFGWADGSKRTLTLADPSSAGDLGAWPGGAVMKIPEWNAKQLRRTARDFIDKHVVLCATQDIASVTLPSAGGPVIYKRDGAGQWKSDKGPSVDSKGLDAVLGQLVRSEYHAEQDISPQDAGLAPPAWAISVVTKDGKRFELELSDKRKENNPYGRMRINGKAERLFTISAMMVQVIRKTAEELKPKSANAK